MFLTLKRCYILIMLLAFIIPGISLADTTRTIPILCYHNFNPSVPGSMNLTPARLEEQLTWLKDHGYTFIPLQDAVAYLQGKEVNLPPKPIVLTADDGWQSVYTYLYPIAREHHIPVTLFIYPETISSGKHAMTWDELTELQKTGLFDIQGHTYSHPNFKQERKHLSADGYNKMVTNELVHSKAILEEKMHKKITLLAWPFGIYDDYLEQQAEAAGYAMSFSIDAKKADRHYQPMAQPRYMIVQGLSMKSFEAIMK